MPNNASKAEEFDRAIGPRLREQRLARQITQAAIGRQIGCTYQQVHKYETGVNRITVGRLIVFAGALGVPLGQILPPISVPAGAGEAIEVAR